MAMIAAAIAVSACGNRQEVLTPAESLTTRLGEQIGQGKIMFGQQGSDLYGHSWNVE